jgi:hypothetical protein
VAELVLLCRTRIFPKRSCQRVVIGPSTIDSTKQRVVLPTERSRPLSNRFGYSIVCKFAIAWCECFGPIDRSRKRSLDCPSLAHDSGSECGSVDTATPGPFLQRESFSIECQQVIVTFIRRLFELCRPTAVVRTIGTSVVNALNRVMQRWTSSHVGNECWKRCAPRRADYNPAPAVILEATMRRAVATALHAYPHRVEWVFVAHAMRFHEQILTCRRAA